MDEVGGKDPGDQSRRGDCERIQPQQQISPCGTPRQQKNEG